MRLSQRVRALVEADLRSYRAARDDVWLYRQREIDLTSPPSASYSYIGATRGAPGDPTYHRGRALAELTGTRTARDAISRVAAVDAWRAEAHPDDYAVVSLIYGLDEPYGVPLPDACAARGIPCASQGELAACEAHLRGLLAELGRRLGHAGRGGGWGPRPRLTPSRTARSAAVAQSA